MQETQAAPAKPQAASDAQQAVFKLTPAAVKQIREVMEQQSLTDHLLVVRVVPSGCSGLGYDLNLLKDSKAGDLLWHQDEIPVATDAVSAKYLMGTEVDYVKGDTAAGFKFHNPNAKSACGCGSSFTA